MIDVITDCQYGSTGKGALAGWLARKNGPDVLACAFSPNAGHTFIDSDGRTLVHKMLPLGLTSYYLNTIVHGPGSLLDLDVFVAEVKAARDLGYLQGVQFLVHENAAVVLDRHREAEANGGTAPGSTRKGCGEAHIERVKRNPSRVNVVGRISQDHEFFDLVKLVSTKELQSVYAKAEHVQVEGCQGYSLSVYHGQYPYCTYRDVTTASLLSDCGVPHGMSTQVYGTFRTYPIRVANRPEAGEWSGPAYPDSKEVTFESIGQKQELTTVTKLPRRIFTFSHTQAEEACAQNGVDVAFLNFANYCQTFEELEGLLLSMGEYTDPALVGFGPTIRDLYEVTSRGELKEIYEDYRSRAAG
jgi:adenylosuccinate synthase